MENVLYILKHIFDSMSRLVLGVHSVSYKVVTRDFLGVKTAERRATTLPLLRTVVNEYVDPCIHILRGPSWTVMEIT